MMWTTRASYNPTTCDKGRKECTNHSGCSCLPCMLPGFCALSPSLMTLRILISVPIPLQAGDQRPRQKQQQHSATQNPHTPAGVVSCNRPLCRQGLNPMASSASGKVPIWGTARKRLLRGSVTSRTVSIPQQMLQSRKKKKTKKTKRADRFKIL